MRGAIVLAGGPSQRLGRPKALVQVGGVPLVARVMRAAGSVADEVVVVARGASVARIEPLVHGVEVVRDRRRIQTPLVGLMAGATALQSEYVAALACDLPFLQRRLLERLFTYARGRDAAIPRWPDGEVEPLVAVYRRIALLAAVRASLDAGERANQEMIRHLPDVRFVRTDTLRSADPSLLSFFNVNRPGDLATARRLARTTSQAGGRRRRR